MKAHESILTVLVVLSILILVALVALTYEASRLQTQPGVSTTITNRNMISISATGTAYNKSSQADLSIDVNGTGLTNAAAVKNVSESLSLFNSTISKYVNGNLSQISTTYFNVYKLYNMTGYQATEGLSVTIPNISNVSGAIGAISSIPNIYVSYATPSLSDAQISKMRVTALSLALSNATSQAHALIGNDTIYATNISINNYYVYPFTYGLASPPAESASGGISRSNISITPQFYGGLNKVTESITVTFSYGPAQK
jgi:uncharacterized protein YggE